MASTVAVVGVCAALAVAASGLAVAGQAHVAAHRATVAADAAALAAADISSGALAGDPCGAAAAVAAAHGVEASSCVVDGGIATIAVGDTFLGLYIEVWARAGPAPGSR